MNVLPTNWKTTLAGILAIGTAIGPVLEDVVKGDYSSALAQLPTVIAGIGLILAKDFDVRI